MESRGEPFEGKVAVAEVIRNRMQSGKFGKTATEVCLAPYQFSGWNTKDVNRTKALLLDGTDAEYLSCLDAWHQALDHRTDSVRGAVLYYNPKIVKTPPNWADPKKFVVKIGSHEFFTE